ncbi:UDP-N-acetylmuramoyl-L-alanine--D-glutamate ligase [Gordonia sp. X0973]|uniref:UDP-N-acetylmuramoyl-L-alanine--D-glutamate ligase n=1 Tax=Gordonia sp. X0973 TaxID=2742602 RepID=UPI000F543480|nr:UDP-N-acetylmuramoyl-L-alanine--D-glutamate ligase [Gordonia sp. X0973]QKT07580.1 UDP-N-acetylmuramoyl-L-alanine--D-glutamate ligase [Gordonia sp. X0973]
MDRQTRAAAELVAGLGGADVLVAGFGSAGRSATTFLTAAQSRVTAIDGAFGAPETVDGVTRIGVDEALGDAELWRRARLLVVSPGFPPDHPLVAAAHAAGVPVWGEVELAWWVDQNAVTGPPRTWLVVTGTNGKTTTTAMLEEIVAASGRTVAACGNFGTPVLDVLTASPRVEVLCVEASSFQLHWAPSLRPAAGVVLNIAEDHLDWHGGMAGYRDAKAGALLGAVAVVGGDDEIASALPVGPTSRRVAFTLGEPAAGELGVVGEMLVDRAFGEPAGEPRELVAAGLIHPPGPSGRADALAAAALALAIGVPAAAVAQGLAGFAPAKHRGERVASRDRADGVAVDFIDDSKATNPHAAAAAIAARDRVVLVAGGLLKGASVDELIRGARERLAGVVAIGRDRDEFVRAIARHAPEVPAVTVFTGDDGRVSVAKHVPGTDSPLGSPDTGAGDRAAADAVMRAAVGSAWELARADGRADAVLLAPAAASLDMFGSYAARGDAFAAAAAALAGATS